MLQKCVSAGEPNLISEIRSHFRVACELSLSKAQQLHMSNHICL